MSLKSSLLAALISLTLFSCSREFKPIAFEEKNITTASNTIVEINIPEAIGSGMASKNINSTLLEKTALALQTNQDSIQNIDIEKNINTFNKAYTEFKTDFPETALEWEAQIDGEVMFQSPEVLSIALTSYTNTGGAHGILVISFLNFDAKSGLLLDNQKLFTDFESFKKLAKSYFDKEIEDKKDLYFDPDTFVLPQNIGYSPDGLTLLYNSYEIAPYSTGITEFVIPFSEADSYLKFNGL
ncbi:DUF3298 and DUF4163 domain-containing protein [Formosa sp. S-31]|uniref:DUF3298 and DUF4163 domain-containing protein n=1 Tax=Formosa sp. S-31 TaxID=2790949 RepID=UPI003EBE5CA8